MSELFLSPAEARVIAAMVEKSITLPQYYPMTVNAIMLASNQKTCRSPAMNLTEGDVGAALNRLEAERLCVRDAFGGRTTKWRHQFQHQLLLKAPALAVLVTLMLRGPQTAAELRANAAILNGPADADGIADAIQDLSDRSQPLMTLLTRAPGQKEARYAHLVCGAAGIHVADAAEVAAASEVGVAAAAVRSEMQMRIEALEARLTRLERSLGVGEPPAS